MAVTATKAQPASAGTGRPRFHVRMAAACVAIAFLGFSPTYWAPLAQGTLRVDPIVHLHGLLFFAWTLLFLYQSWLVAGGRVMRHRDIGLIGISLATAMFIVGVATAINTAQSIEAAGYAADARRAMIVPLSTITTFAILLAVAIARVRNPETHKRLVTVATVFLLVPAIARTFLLLPGVTAPAGPPPPTELVLIPSAIADLLLVVAMVHDWRRDGRVHSALWIGSLAIVAVQVLRVPVSYTQTWQSIATAIISFAG